MSDDFTVLPPADCPTVPMMFPVAAGVTLFTASGEHGYGGPVVLRFEAGLQQVPALIVGHSYLAAQGAYRLDQGGRNV